MALTNFRPRGDVKANWEAANPIIKEREMCIEWEEAIGVGKPRIKFGKTGSAIHYNDLDCAVLPNKHDTKDNWSSTNPVLENGEVGFEWETTIGEGPVCIKVGDGTTAWNDLDYATTGRLKEIVEPSSDNEPLAVGDTLPVIAGKLNNQQDYLKTKLGYERLDALAAQLSGLSNQDFMGILELLNTNKFDKANVYNGLDSTNTGLALSAAAGNSLSTKLGTGSLPTGMSNVVDGLTQLNSNLELKTVYLKEFSFGTGTLSVVIEKIGKQKQIVLSGISSIEANKFFQFPIDALPTELLPLHNLQKSYSQISTGIIIGSGYLFVGTDGTIGISCTNSGLTEHGCITTYY